MLLFVLSLQKASVPLRGHTGCCMQVCLDAMVWPLCDPPLAFAACLCFYGAVLGLALCLTQHLTGVGHLQVCVWMSPQLPPSTILADPGTIFQPLWGPARPGCRR